MRKLTKSLLFLSIFFCMFIIANTSQAGSILGDYVWEDLDGNGIQDDGDSGIGGVEVSILDEHYTVLASTTTNGSGLYEFNGLTAGRYYVDFLAPTDYFFTRAHQGIDDAVDSDADPVTGISEEANLDGVENKDYFDAGFFRTGSITGFKFHDLNGDGIKDANEPLLGDWIIELLDWTGLDLIATTTTGLDGSYGFYDLRPDSYTLREVLQPGWYPTTPLLSKTFLYSGEDIEVYFGNSTTPAPIPEPSTFILLGGGLAGLFFVARRRKKE